MAYAKKIFNDNFLEYASYVIKDRAIPDLEDGLKPVQRRILHSLFEMDDGKFHKVANVVGHCMKYHPHGDASIYSALVVLANKELFIDKQGNFGNILTGDPAAAGRYIECRALALAKKVLYNPEITQYTESYDGRNKEPQVFRSKIPVILIHGGEGIAVGMSTKILPHNYEEVLTALKSCLNNEPFQLYPDFPTGGMVDVSEYQDGNGKVLVRAKLDISDPKKVLIREIPFGTTTESLMNSIENAARRSKIKVSAITDYTTESAEIEVKLARGAYTNEVVDSLFAFTDCETSISLNLLVIRDGLPTIMTVTEIIKYYAVQIVEILTDELKLEQKALLDKIHARTLERIFIEERIYKRIEEMKTKQDVIDTVITGFAPFMKEIKRDVTEEDVERLLKIPIRRISLYDINKARDELRQLQERLKDVRNHLKHITAYAVSFVDELLSGVTEEQKRKTEVISFNKIDVREAAQRNLSLSYDEETGYLGYEVKSGKVQFSVSSYDRILVIRKSGVYSIINAPDKLFVDKGMLFCGLADKDEMADRVFTILYRSDETGFAHLKRCRIEKFILDKSYELIPDGCRIIKMTLKDEVSVELSYKPKPRLKVLNESFAVKDYLVKGVKAAGVRLSAKEVKNGKFVKIKKK
ncbi:MAG: DNA topoisomerase IV subunit A [Spirochaetales bacterium]|nr:DNA topoisomerase IV subunit A [Spirochaetales bacterium]